MSMNINIAINADDQGKFTEHEQTVLQALAGNVKQLSTEVHITAAEPAKAEPAKADPKPRVTRKPKPEPTAAAILEDPQDEEEEGGVDLDEDEPAADPEPTVKRTPAKKPAPAKELTTRDAISAATPLISEGTAGRAKVKEALGAVEGAKKVSDLKTHDDVAAFLAALEA